MRRKIIRVCKVLGWIGVLSVIVLVSSEAGFFVFQQRRNQQEMRSAHAWLSAQTLKEEEGSATPEEAYRSYYETHTNANLPAPTELRFLPDVVSGIARAAYVVSTPQEKMQLQGREITIPDGEITYHLLFRELQSDQWVFDAPSS